MHGERFLDELDDHDDVQKVYSNNADTVRLLQGSLARVGGDAARGVYASASASLAHPDHW